MGVGIEQFQPGLVRNPGLPQDLQDTIAEHLREYLADLQDELKWDNSFKKTQENLIASAQRAKREIAEGLAKPMDYDKL